MDFKILKKVKPHNPIIQKIYKTINIKTFLISKLIIFLKNRIQMKINNNNHSINQNKNSIMEIIFKK